MPELESKGVHVVTAEFKAVKNTKGTYDLTLSVPVEDRDEEVIDAKAFEPLPEWIPIDIDHGMTVLTTVGSGTPSYAGDDLKVSDFTFASTPLAQEVQALVDEGHIRKMSVAFMAAVRETDDTDGKVHIRKAELLNAAIVAIPSNREADILVAKAAALKVGARNSQKDSAAIQAIHDAASALGAGCEEKAHRRADAKSVAGSFEERSDRLREALREANPTADWVWVRATFDDTVVFEIQAEDGTSTTWQAPYAEEDGTFSIGDAAAVDVTEIVIPPVTNTDPDEDAATAASRPAEVGVAMARALSAEAELLLLDS